MAVRAKVAISGYNHPEYNQEWQTGKVVRWTGYGNIALIVEGVLLKPWSGINEYGQFVIAPNADEIPIWYYEWEIWETKTGVITASWKLPHRPRYTTEEVAKATVERAFSKWMKENEAQFVANGYRWGLPG